MSTAEEFNELVAQQGSPVRFHRDESVTPCPCRTPEGFRDLEWHVQHPSAPICSPNGMLPSSTPVDRIVKGFVQPIQSTRATRLQAEQLIQLFGDVQADDHLGIFPLEWEGQVLDFYDWGESGEDFIEYNNRRFMVVNVNVMPDPDGGNLHHTECGLRLIHD